MSTPNYQQDLARSKQLYRARRDAFQSNSRATRELDEWKQRNNDYEYDQLSSGLIPTETTDDSMKERHFQKSDTIFSEFGAHNDQTLILSESPDSYIIANSASYDRRQYPQWLNPACSSGHTPEGQGFGHCLVIPKKRVFNVVDPDATADNCSVIREMGTHFQTFWEGGGSSIILERVRKKFEQQNSRLARDDRCDNALKNLLPTLTSDLEKFTQRFSELAHHDFVFGFHAYPDNSVGHLHMHVYPREGRLREFSTRRHDWKTIPLEAVLKVECEDRDGGEAFELASSSIDESDAHTERFFSVRQDLVL